MQRIMNFPSAIREIIEGNKVTKLEWDNQEIYIFLHEGLLKIHKEDGSIPRLIVSEADMVGTDWVTINEPVTIEADLATSPSIITPKIPPSGMIGNE